MNKNKISLLLATLLLSACQPGQQADNKSVAAAPEGASASVPDYWPKLDIAIKPDAAVEARVKDLLAKMTLEQKVAQVIQPEIRDITVEDMRRYGFGSYLNGGGAFPNNDKHATVDDWVSLAESLYQASMDDSLDGIAIPTMWGTDAVHGHNNVIGATLFPHNIGLGAMRNADLLEQIAAATAKEVRATGIDWIFAPTVAVARDDRWGRTYESYSEDPALVKEYAEAIVRGLQGRPGKNLFAEDKVISTVKHFVGDGGTEGGDDQGNNLASEKDLFAIHAQGYVSGLSAGSQSVMASFNSWQGDKIHGNRYLLTEVLKERMGFDGFVVGDWNGHGQVAGCSNSSCPQAMNAGLDIYMVPTDAWKPLMENIIAQVQSGEIPQARLDDAVTRILRVKIRAGLFEQASPANRALSADKSLIGAQAHRDIARQAVRESLVLLKNSEQLLPLNPAQHILVAGDGADNIGKQSGGWSITWQGTGNENADFPGGTSIYQGIRDAVQGAGGSVELAVDGQYQQKPQVAIVVFGEEPYAEGNGDLANLEYQRGNKQDLALLKKLKADGIKVVSVFLSGRPLWVNPEINASDAFVAAWLPGSEGQGVADVIIADKEGKARHDFKGKLSFSWPATPDQATVNMGDAGLTPLLAYGFGLNYGETGPLDSLLPEDVQPSHAGLENLDILMGNVKAPLMLQIGTVGDMAAVTSSVQQQGAVSLRTMDRVVQEDARSISFDGSDTASIAIGAPFPQDLRAYPEAGGALQFDLRIVQSAEKALEVRLECGDNCESRLPLQLSENQDWQTQTLPLHCFKNMDFAKVFSPFALQSRGAWQFDLSNVQWLSTVDSALACPKQAP
ncbi:glycoside hydrolase family 3 N-terminal domain-containing protein [Aliiglaciecola sp. CAU 1673]|uniref:glycoside hydrolase family 3 protein n=1 Tax=Aliiglaciecola sp. CAU 1673 TaxID=3032595 RepID=UPI0023DAC05B|nr:glycoside hydrolase family 3 N-terminal domain-containing protein [Aliiglaciecola sp. CAU 1673]MDF2178808.1 glycoside hydrolase family 3 N-terminal domain-containing protein [Aliiglaciecola sp. CAU 1673]